MLFRGQSMLTEAVEEGCFDIIIFADTDKPIIIMLLKQYYTILFYQNEKKIKY